MNWQDMIGGVVNKPTRTEASLKKMKDKKLAVRHRAACWDQ